MERRLSIKYWILDIESKGVDWMEGGVEAWVPNSFLEEMHINWEFDQPIKSGFIYADVVAAAVAAAVAVEPPLSYHTATGPKGLPLCCL